MGQLILMIMVVQASQAIALDDRFPRRYDGNRPNSNVNNAKSAVRAIHMSPKNVDVVMKSPTFNMRIYVGL